MIKTTNLKATFKAYMNPDKDLLVSKLAHISGWNYIGQPRASAEINHIEVDVFFSKNGKRVKDAIRGNTILGAWRLQSIN